MAILDQVNYNQEHATKREWDTPQVLLVHHHKYVYVLGTWKNHQEGYSIDGYMNPKDFSQHKIKIRKQHIYHHRHARRHAHKTHRMNRADREMQHMFLGFIKTRRHADLITYPVVI